MFQKFFYPKSICIPGASSKEKSIGYELLKTIKSFGFTGSVYPVNPSAGQILGFQCYSSIADIQQPIDLAIVVVPKKFVTETIELLLKKEVKSIILITAGFRETGQEGKAAEEKLLEMIKGAGARLVGPNCMGIINSFSDIKLNATFVAEHPRESRAAFLSQSGALGAAVLNSLRETNVSFGHFISVGNKTDVNENDLLDFWQADKKISAISMYLESFVNGEEFIQKISDPSFTKPLVIVKAGKTAAGMKAASSHTGALGSSDRVADSVLRQFGVIRAETVSEMFNTLKGYENFPLPAGGRIAVVTNAGGPAILCVDAIEKAGLTLAALSEKTKETLRTFVHPEGSVNNPVDLLPGGSAEQFRLAVDTVLADSGVDAVINIFVEPVMVPAMPVAESLSTISHQKPVYQVFLPLPEFWPQYNSSPMSAIPVFRNPEEPSYIISNLLRYSARLNEKINPGPNNLRLRKETAASLTAGPDDILPGNWLSEAAIRRTASAYDIPLICSDMVPADLAEDYNPAFGFPVVLKGIAAGITHKSDLQLVEINIRDKESFVATASKMIQRAGRNGIAINGFLVQPFLSARFELLIGGFRDPSFGPMIMFGSGGKFVEIWNDTTIRSAYISKSDIQEMLADVKIGRLLAGVRGEKPADIERISDTILSCAKMMINHDEILEFDLNPLIVTHNNTIACVDARIKVR